MFLVFFGVCFCVGGGGVAFAFCFSTRNSFLWNLSYFVCFGFGVSVGFLYKPKTTIVIFYLW